MAQSIQDCSKNVKIEGAQDLFTRLRMLEMRNDAHCTSSEVPELHTAAQQTDFCNVYDEMVGHYQAFSMKAKEEVSTR